MLLMLTQNPADADAIVVAAAVADDDDDDDDDLWWQIFCWQSPDTKNQK